MASGAMLAAMNRQVKARIPARPPLSPLRRVLLASALFLAAAGLAPAQSTPSAAEILQQLRANQTQQHRTLLGSLRNGPSKLNFRLVLDGTTLKYQFTDPPPSTLVLRLGANGAQLTEVTGRGANKVSDDQFAQPVRGSDLTFEDVAMRFLYWPDATVLGADSIILRPCWKIEMKPGPGDKTAYAKVIAWIDQESGALMNAQAFDAKGQLATAFKLIEPQMISGLWLPRKIRIQRMKDGKPIDGSPTYLMIDGILKE